MRIILITFLLISTNSFSQLLSGGLKDEGRVVVSETPFLQEGTVDGWAKYELAVDRKGNVTSAKIIETNLKRTSAKMQIRDYVMTMKFTPGTIYPHFHHGIVKITLVKSANAPKQKEIIID